MVSVDTSIGVGASVNITGLTQRPDLNGRRGDVLRWMADAERWAVRVVDTGESVRVRTKNLAAALGAPMPDELRPAADSDRGAGMATALMRCLTLTLTLT